MRLLVEVQINIFLRFWGKGWNFGFKVHRTYTFQKCPGPVGTCPFRTGYDVICINMTLKGQNFGFHEHGHGIPYFNRKVLWNSQKKYFWMFFTGYDVIIRYKFLKLQKKRLFSLLVEVQINIYIGFLWKGWNSRFEVFRTYTIQYCLGTVGTCPLRTGYDVIINWYLLKRTNFLIFWP